MLLLFLQYLCFQMHEMTKFFTDESCTPNRRIFSNVQLLGPYWGNVWAKLGLCFGQFCNIFAFRCLKWLNFSLKSHACQIEDCSSIFQTISGQCLDHNRAMFWLFLQYLCFQMLEMAEFFTEESCMPNRRILFNDPLLGPQKAMLGPYQGHVLAISTIYLLLDS